MMYLIFSRLLITSKIQLKHSQYSNAIDLSIFYSRWCKLNRTSSSSRGSPKTVSQVLLKDIKTLGSHSTSMSPPRADSRTVSYRRTHNLLLATRLLNQRDTASPFTLILDSLNQSARPLVKEYIRRASVRSNNIKHMVQYKDIQANYMFFSCNRYPR